jgi:hypothetical protein
VGLEVVGFGVDAVGKPLQMVAGQDLLCHCRGPKCSIEVERGA